MKQIINRFGIVLVIAVWGIVAIPFIKIFFPSQSTALESNSLFEKIDDISYTLSDVYALETDFVDPFLKNSIKTTFIETKSAVAKKENTSKKHIAPTAIEWPKIAYNGMVKNKQSNKQLGLFIINDMEAILTTGQEFEKVKLLKITKDSVLMEFDKKKKYFKNSS